MKKIFEVVKILDVEPFSAGDGDLFRFRLEVIKEIDADLFSGKVYRLETYRLQPTFFQTDGGDPDLKNDALIFVMDEMFDPDALKGSSLQEVISKFQFSFKKIFGAL